MESIGQSFDPYYEYHYSPMPMESPPTNQEAGTEAVGVDGSSARNQKRRPDDGRYQNGTPNKRNSARNMGNHGNEIKTVPLWIE
ncbi:hypothetical protein Bca52824_016889 [Brassica carinata]|uniref:Uncharacterized protein n=1 Tax=Brassica carinata TaxID=52824 RepID=A0A8X7W4Y2_BRACI|nr:hypothetical protein Bca52824_016889 [Brassica carinata]